MYNWHESNAFGIRVSTLRPDATRSPEIVEKKIIGVRPAKNKAKS
jgi:hypothetical protein